MKHTGRYFEPGGVAEPPAVLGVPPEESVLGWYLNPPPWENAAILFTDKAMYAMEGEKTMRLALGDIVGYESPKSKTDVTGLRVRTRDGFRFLRVSGSFGPHGDFKDAFSLIQVIRAIARQNPE